MIDFASVRKDATNEQRSTIFQLIDTPADAEALRSVLNDLMTGKHAVTTLPLTIQGRKQLTGIAWIPDIRWFVVTMAHPKAVSAASHLPGTLPALVVALMSILLIAAIIIQRTVVSRLSKLDAAAKNLSEGNYLKPIADPSTDEIGRLTRSFDVMANRILSHTSDLERQVAERTAALEKMAHTDFLTGCLNRRGMMTRLEIEKGRLKRQNMQLGILVLDLDHFKQINDRYGHAAGDIVLTGVAGVLRDGLRAYDAVARWGGEEFLIGMFGLNQTHELDAIAHKLLEAIRSANFVSEGKVIQCTVSIGAILAAPDDDLDRVLSEADKALYSAKHSGRDQVVIAD